MILKDMNGFDFEKVDKSVAILPVGSIERHGDHLPLGTDSELPEHIARRAADLTGAIVMPTIFYGSCHAMRGFPGTFDIDSEVLFKYIECILEEAWRNGIKLVVVLNGHGGNATPIQMAARQAASRTGLSVVVLDWWKDLGNSKKSLFSSPGHAGEDETSAMLAVDEGKVNIYLAGRHEVTYPEVKIYSKKIDERLYEIALTGDAKKATKEKGEELMSAVVEDLAKVIEDLRKALEI
ncbi:MAG: creatininase family protein [Candidatus Methanosuratincola verstraetei]|jgi:creatinine amidohydrolase|uniref:Creatinine amidohydrolase n=1 Tax=Methanosuratincola subterraneus TaxID=2593994 RepID=A0A444L9I9_METS7|nr:MAG: Creatinine amidohydrolase [Candidatus Methanosuratincola subterraneus]